jgi:P-type conjugative transfer protein TrbJ
MMKKTLVATAAAIVLLATGSVRDAKAQFAVIDPANLVENIISALQNVQTVLNQVTQISHEVQSLAYQAQNLRTLPTSVSGSVLGQYTTQFASLVAAMGSINGIANNLSTLTAQYNSTYPNSALAQGSLSNANINSQLTAWLNQSRSVYQGAYNTQAQVIGSLRADSTNVQTLLQTSGSSQGALDAIQAGNQLSGQIAAQLMKINTQMATTNQAQMNWIAQQTQMIAQAQKTSQNAMVGYTAPSTAPVSLTYDRFH